MNDIWNALRNMAARKNGFGILAEITEATGSTPRGAGARMFLDPEGHFSGTVGGGTVEYHAQCTALELLRTGETVTREYSLGGTDAVGVCGGHVTVRLSPVTPEDAASLLSDMEPPRRVYLYGAGHVGKALCDALYLLDIPVTVTDDRAALLTEERFPHAVRILHSLDDAPMEPESYDFIVIMTHGHEHDFVLTARAMATGAEYVGLMSSRKKVAITRKILLEKGFSEEDIDRRLHSPIGLAIGAETPEEIAVSIVAEIIQIMRK